MLDIHNLMTSLASRRPIFHSEADFQHALAWHIHGTHPECDVRLEFNPFPNQRRNMALDIWLRTSWDTYAIELKYGTLLLEREVQGEYFALRNQSAQDIKRYDFLRDVERIEQVTANHERASRGLAVFLTNDQGYWNPPNRPNTVDADFRIHDGHRVGGGQLRWGANASPGTMSSREEPISLSNSYTLNWHDYSTFGSRRGQRFRYLAVAVPPAKEHTL